MSWAMNSGASAVMPTTPTLMCCTPLAAALAAGLALADAAALATGLALAGAASLATGLAAAVLAGAEDAGAAAPPQADSSKPASTKLDAAVAGLGQRRLPATADEHPAGCAPEPGAGGRASADDSRWHQPGRL